MTKYRTIAARVAEEIANGHFQPGDRVYSVSDLCDRFKISHMTAVRVQRALEQRGAVRLVRGGGAFANAVADFAAAAIAGSRSELKRVVVLRFRALRKETFHRETLRALFQRCEERGLESATLPIARQSTSLDAVNGIRPEPQTGYVVISDSVQSHFAGGALLLSPNVRSVLIDSIVTGSHAVLPDHFDGMRQLVDHLAERGYRRLFYAGGLSGFLGMINHEERRLAFELRGRYGNLDARVVEHRDFDALVEQARAGGPRTAFLFGQDDLALRFRKILRERGVSPLPGITGFDGFAIKEPGLETLTTLQVDRAAMGRATVDVLFESIELPRVVRVPGRLRVGEST